MRSRAEHMIQETLPLTDLPYTEITVEALACNERPSRRLDTFGPAALSDTELLTLVLQGSRASRNPLALATRLISEAGSLARLAAWHRSDFERLSGIGPTTAAQLIALGETARRMNSQSAEESPLLNTAQLIADYLRPLTTGLEVEKFWVLCLNRKNRLLKRVEITSGTATATLAHPREVFRAAIRESSAALVCAHNHPSGDPAPSSADIQITRLLRDAGKAVEISLVDHVVVGRNSADPTGRGYYSFRESGLI